MWIGRLIVRSLFDVKGPAVKQWLGMVNMEMGPYADPLFNTILGTLILTSETALGCSSFVWQGPNVGCAPSTTSACFAPPLPCHRCLRTESLRQTMFAPIIRHYRACWAVGLTSESGVHRGGNNKNKHGTAKAKPCKSCCAASCGRGSNPVEYVFMQGPGWGAALSPASEKAAEGNARNRPKVWNVSR